MRHLVTIVSFAVAVGIAIGSDADAATVLASDDIQLNDGAGTVGSIDNRLIVSGDPTDGAGYRGGVLQFDTSGVTTNVNLVASATLRLWLQQNSLHGTTSRNVVANILNDSVDGWTEGAAPNPFPLNSVGSASPATLVDPTAASQYWDFDVTALLKSADGVGNGLVGFRMDSDHPGGAASGSSFRFTDRDPANDSSPHNLGQPPLLVIELVPEPASLGLMAVGSLMLIRRGRRQV